MTEQEEKLFRACSAALARRGKSRALVISFEEIQNEYEKDALEVTCDSEAHCIRVSLPEVRA